MNSLQRVANVAALLVQWGARQGVIAQGSSTGSSVAIHMAELTFLCLGCCATIMAGGLSRACSLHAFATRRSLTVVSVRQIPSLQCSTTHMVSCNKSTRTTLYPRIISSHITWDAAPQPYHAHETMMDSLPVCEINGLTGLTVKVACTVSMYAWMVLGGLSLMLPDGLADAP